MTVNQDVLEEVTVKFYKESGKFYARGVAKVNPYHHGDDYIQDIVDTQTAMGEGWEGSFSVVVSAVDDADTIGFHEKMYRPQAFHGFSRKPTQVNANNKLNG